MSVWNAGYNYVQQRAYVEEARDDVVELFLRAVRCACEVGLVSQDALPLIVGSINKGDIDTALKILKGKNEENGGNFGSIGNFSDNYSDVLCAESSGR